MPDLHRFKALSSSTEIAIAGGEQGTNRSYFTRILGEEIYGIIVPDVKYKGGIANLLDIATLAAQHGVTFSPHNLSGPVAHFASLHAMAVIKNPGLLAHQYDEDPLF